MPLLTLPPELHLEIITHLPTPSLYHFTLTHPRLYAISVKTLLLRRASPHTFPIARLSLGSSRTPFMHHTVLSNHLLLTIKDGNLRAPNPLVCHEPFVWAAVYARLYLLKLVLMQFRGRMAFKVKSWDWESAFVFRSRDKMKSATAMLLTDPVLSGVVLGRSTGQGGFEGSFLWGGWRRLFEMMVGELKAKGECGFGARDDNGMTPLVLASVLGDGKSVRALLDAGAEPVVEVHGKTAVEWSRYMGHEDVTEVLTSWLVNKGLGVPVPVVGELEIDPEFVKRKDYFSIYNKYQRWMGEDTVRMRIHLTPRVVGAGPGGRP